MLLPLVSLCSRNWSFVQGTCSARKGGRVHQHGAAPAGASQGVEEGFCLSPHVWFFGVLFCFLLWFSLRISVFCLCFSHPAEEPRCPSHLCTDPILSWSLCCTGVSSREPPCRLQGTITLVGNSASTSITVPWSPLCSPSPGDPTALEDELWTPGLGLINSNLSRFQRLGGFFSFSQR